MIYLFADMRGVPALGNAAIDMSHERTAAIWVADSHILDFVY